MASHSPFLDALTDAEKVDLDKRLYDRQSGKCFICDNPVDLVLHKGQLEVDHIEPLAEGGADSENNFALVHSQCNRQKGASDLRVARRMAEFDRLQEEAKKAGERGANLGRVLARYGGAKLSLRLKEEQDQVRFSLGDLGDPTICSTEVYHDQLSDMRYFFALWPMEYLHHDDRINPRSIGPNIR